MAEAAATPKRRTAEEAQETNETTEETHEDEAKIGGEHAVNAHPSASGVHEKSAHACFRKWSRALRVNWKGNLPHRFPVTLRDFQTYSEFIFLK